MKEIDSNSDDDFEVANKQGKHALTVGRSDAREKSTSLQRSKVGGGQKNAIQKKTAGSRLQKKGTTKTRNTNVLLEPKPLIDKATKKVRFMNKIDSNDDSGWGAVDSDSDRFSCTKAHREKKSNPVEA